MANGDYSEGFIQAKLWDHFYQKYKYMFTNMKYFSLENENDFIGVTDKGITIEYEIKTRKFDFADDFKKTKKHEKLKKAFASKDKNIDFEVPNRLFYACPPGIINKKNVPPYAGLVEVDEYKVRVVKNAPLLHKTLYNPAQFFDRIYLKVRHFWNQDFTNILHSGDIKRKTKSPYKPKKRVKEVFTPQPKSLGFLEEE